MLHMKITPELNLQKKKKNLKVCSTLLYTEEAIEALRDFAII
jgi:hypothetical protein